MSNPDKSHLHALEQTDWFCWTERSCTRAKAKWRGTLCTDYTWTFKRPKAPSPVLKVWEKRDKWHQLTQERWGIIPSCIWPHKCHLEAAWMASSIHSVDKSTMQEMLDCLTSRFSLAARGSFQVDPLPQGTGHKGSTLTSKAVYCQTECICPEDPPCLCSKQH